MHETSRNRSDSNQSKLRKKLHSLNNVYRLIQPSFRPELHKTIIFGGLLVASIIGLVGSIYVLETLYQSQLSTGYMSEMMSQMMGGGGMNLSEQTPIMNYMWVIPPALIGLVLVALTGLVYFFVFPEIKKSNQPIEPTVSIQSSDSKSLLDGKNASALLNTLKPDEKIVFEVLASHGGKYLQKNISKEANLNRLKTHRIVARLSERNIVVVRPFGNTNEVSISDWITSEKGKD